MFPDQHGFGRSFAKVIEKDAYLEGIFESFVRNSYKAEQSVYRLRDGAERLKKVMAPIGSRRYLRPRR